MSKKFFGKILSGLLCLMMTAVIFCPDNTFKANAGDVSEMSPNQNTYDFIFQLEGCDLHCFWDVAQWTIGYGTRCPYHHSGKGSYTGQRGGHTINKEQAMDIFKEEFPQYVKTLRSNCAGLSMNQNQFDALLSAVYNHGNVRNCPLKSYLLGELTEEEARAKYAVWCINAGTSTEKGLRRRRQAEADLFFTPCEESPKETEPEFLPAPPAGIVTAFSKQSFTVGEEVLLTISSDTGVCYQVTFEDKDGKEIGSYRTEVDHDTPVRSYTHVFEESGNYACYVTAYNDFGFTVGEKLYFTVEKKTEILTKTAQ